MTIREVLQYPNDILRRVAEPVGTLTEPVLAVCDDLVHTMRHGNRPAVGLAAPQIGVSLRIFVMEERLESGRAKVYVCINPEITKRVGQTAIAEGCLSFPVEAYVRATRAARITLTWTDRQDHQHEKQFSGLLAVCAQHELDHLDGKLMTDYGELQTRKDSC